MRTPPRPVEPWSHVVRLDDGSRDPRGFELTPDAQVRAALAERLGILGLRKLRFAGRLVAEGARDWRLEAELGATVSQACVASLQPVTTRIDEPVERRYHAEIAEPPAGEEIEMPDETVEPLPGKLDVGAVMAEALALALPPWPRAAGVELGAQAFAAPGVRPIAAEDTKPFAALRGLLDRDENER